MRAVKNGVRLASPELAIVATLDKSGHVPYGCVDTTRAMDGPSASPREVAPVTDPAYEEVLIDLTAMAAL
jgi:hypothetical protein